VLEKEETQTKEIGKGNGVCLFTQLQLVLRWVQVAGDSTTTTAKLKPFGWPGEGERGTTAPF
jgi:hypothetical protein